MGFKRFFKWIIKAVIACTIAFAMVSGGCLIYYNIPVHYSNSAGATDYKWETLKFYSKCTEGFALGRTDSDGFNNTENVNGRRIDILFTGSSHGEAFNVAQDKNCVSLLNSMFDGEMFTYNIAVSGHTLYHICSNLSKALETYKPSKYVVIECQSLELAENNILAAVDGTLPELESESGGVIGFLQKIPYLRLMYLQISNLRQAEKPAETVSVISETPDEQYRAAVKALVEKAKADCEKYNVTPIIIYHPHFKAEQNGSIKILHNENYVSLFRNICSEVGVRFVEMTSDFVNGYKKDLMYPYGYSNTVLGEGHLNTYGHKLIAERLYKTIEDMEAEK